MNELISGGGKCFEVLLGDNKLSKQKQDTVLIALIENGTSFTKLGENIIKYVKGWFKFNSGDYQFLKASKPLSFCAYLKKHEKEVLDNFDAFFTGIEPASINTMIASSETPKTIKQKLITQLWNRIVIDDGCASQYVNAIKNNGLGIPTNFLVKFQNSKLSDESKLDLLNSVNDFEPFVQLIIAYVLKAKPEFTEAKKEVRLRNKGNTFIAVMQKFADNQGLKMSKSKKDSNELIFKVA